VKVASVRDINWNATRTLTYQAGGDLYQDARSGGITYSYSYNARNRAVEIMKNNVEVGAYGHDAFEHRVWREVFSPSTVQTHYIYDLDGRLLAEQNGGTGTVVKEYAWIDDMPLAVIDSSSGTPTTYYIHTGPVDEPLAMTNSAKAIVWNAYMEPFGAATVFGTASASIDMRLPGQSLEAESGNLNQNWFRHYDPSLRRYIQGDPLS
jgi:RHS repeat-associated protein